MLTQTLRKYLTSPCARISRLPRKLEINQYTQDDLAHYTQETDKINKVQWTKEQQKEFDFFWKKNYGKEIPNTCHKLFQSINGVYNPEYIPNDFYRKKIEPFLNPDFEADLYQSKNLSEFLFSGIEGLRFPKTLLSCMNGCYRIDNKLFSKAEAAKELSDIGKAIIKPSKWSGAGRSVALIDIQNGIDKITGSTLESIIEKYGNYFVVQELIQNNEEIRKIAPGSLNTFRVITYLLDGKVYSAPLGLRLGSGESVVDNLCAGGMVIGVKEDGTLHKTAHTYGISHYTPFEKHPYSGIIFADYYVGDINKMIEKAKEMHSHITSIGIVGWDMTLDENNTPVMIEANLLNIGADFVQFSTGEGLFKGHTEEMLQQIK